MAVIQKLRNSGLVVVVIIAALVLFVVGDILTGNRLGLGDDLQGVAGSINGNQVKTKDLESKAQNLFNTFLERAQEGELNDPENFKKALEQAWSQGWSEILRNQTIDKELELSGVRITDEDINDLLVGPNPLEYVKGDPNFQTDGRYDRKKVEDLFRKNRKDKNRVKALNTYVNSIRQSEGMKRYGNFIAKCLYKPKSVKKYEYITANASVSGKLVNINYSTIPDNSIKVTDGDLERYLDEHRELYKNKEELRDIQYLVWKITPSSEDSAYVQKQALGAIASMKEETNPDTAGEGVSMFVSRGSLPKSTPKEVSEIVWSMPTLAVAGPFYKDGVYSVYRKIAEKKDSTPSVNVAHILIKVGEAPNKQLIADTAAALAKANELAAQIRGGADMAKLAADWSSDPGSASNGGSYGWVGKETYNNYVPSYRNFALRAVKGQVEVVKSELGLHVMKALADPDYTQIKYEEQKFEIVAGNKTVKEVDQVSRKFRNMVNEGDVKSFQNAIDKMGLNVLVQKDVKSDVRALPGIEDYSDIRSILDWMFDSKRKKNDVSDRFAFSNRHVVIFMNSVKHLGYAELEEVREKIEPLVKTELKAAKIREKLEKAMEKAKTIEELAQKSGGSLIQLDGVRMGQAMANQSSNDMKIVGALFGVELKKISKPIDGNNGVAVAFIEKRDKIEVPNAVLTNTSFQYTGEMLMNFLGQYASRSAEITDYRYKYTESAELNELGNIILKLK
ncbi:MAG: peptidylprolyl isomerase [Sphingomonadales bacterium]|jgi:peptidyl-prolyl cis-trans isomerase D